MPDPDQASYPIVPIHAILGSKRRPGQTIAEVKFIVAHDTGNVGASARGHAAWYRNDPNPKSTSSAHLFVDDEDIVETVPALTAPAEWAYHVLFGLQKDNQMFNADANSSAIGVEYCFGGTIDADKAYDRYVWVLARLCQKFNLSPASRIVGHQVLDPDRRSDPDDGLKRSNRSYATLLTDVVARFATLGDPPSETQVTMIRPGRARATVNLNRRKEPRRSADKLDALKPGDEITVAEVVKGEMVMGTDRWCQIAEKDFCWSGGLVMLPAPSP